MKNLDSCMYVIDQGPIPLQLIKLLLAGEKHVECRDLEILAFFLFLWNLIKIPGISGSVMHVSRLYH